MASTVGKRVADTLRGRSVAILGAGTQGSRLAYMWSSCGGPVNLIDRNKTQLEKAVVEIEKWKSGIGSRAGHRGGRVTLFAEDETKAALEDAWLVVECVPESFELKKTVVGMLDDLAGPESIVASNSSSYTITEIIENLSLKDPTRCVSLHSYWPPETPAIEVMPTTATRSEIVPLLMEQCKAHGFSPFHVKKNSNGYIYNRIWAAIKRESLLVAAEGVATPAEIDAIYKDVLKTPKGPFEQMDIVGLDVVRDIEEHYAENRKGLPEEPRRLLQDMIKLGKLGVKSGQGFYGYK